MSEDGCDCEMSTLKRQRLSVKRCSEGRFSQVKSKVRKTRLAENSTPAYAKLSIFTTRFRRR